jgi:hypothetical protein
VFAWYPLKLMWASPLGHPDAQPGLTILPGHPPRRWHLAGSKPSISIVCLAEWVSGLWTPSPLVSCFAERILQVRM